MSSPGLMLSRALRKFTVLVVLAIAVALLPAGLLAPAHAAPVLRGGNDPAGNNGTVKIVEDGDFDAPPNNDPHVGCTFTVEWYGFDKGDDIISEVTFEMQAPTQSVGLTVTGPPTVFVGGDAASGAGTPTGLDGRQAYTLAFDGPPHPTQGYHVKLTIETPGSQGSDKKHKVFWVQKCTPPQQPADIFLDKQVLDANADGVGTLGELLTYSFHVTNTGTVPLHNVTITDPMFGLTNAACVTDLAVGATTDCPLLSPQTHIVTQADVDHRSVENEATTSGLPPTGPPVTDDDDATIPVSGPHDNEVDLVVEKTSDVTIAGPGDNVVYTINVRNQGDGDAHDVVVTDMLPQGTTYVSSSAPCTYASGTVTCNLGTIEDGDDRTVTITVKVNASASSGGNTQHQHQMDYTKVESHIAAFEGDTSSTTQCPTGYVATDGSVRLDHVDQGAGTFEDVDVLQSAVTSDGKGWTGTVRNNTSGQVQAKVEVVCASERTVSGEDHSHPLVITGPSASTQTFGPGRHTVDLTCASGSYPIQPSFVLTAGTAVVGTHGAGPAWQFIIDVDDSATGTFSIHCLSSALGTAAGHSHDLVFKALSDTVTVPVGGTVERKLTCPDGYKGIVAWADIDPGLVSLGNDPQPITRVYKFYNPTSGPLSARFGLLCVAIRTNGDDHPGDSTVTNTASAATSSHDVDPGDNSDSATITVSATGVTVTPRASVSSSAGRTTVQLGLATGSKRAVSLKLLAAGKVAGLRGGAVLAQGRATLKAGHASVRIVARGAAAKALRSGKVGKARLVIVSHGHRDVRVIRLR